MRKLVSHFPSQKLTLFLGVLFCILAQKSTGQLIISEYLEGSGNDKCIEIFNTTSAPINLTGYNLKVYFNGSTSVGSTINLTGTIAACGVYVVCNNTASGSLTSISNLTSGGLSFNGDDAVGLYNGTTLLDLFGNIGEDPGTEWTGVGNGTADEGVVRTPSNCTGVTTDPAVGFPTFTTANWSAVGMTGATLGSHTNLCAACSASAVTITTGTISGGPFSIACTSGASGSIAFTSTGTFNAGNIFTAQLSDNTGSFAAPLTVGTLSGPGAVGLNPSGNISFTIPPALPSGTYSIRITSSNPASISGNSTTLTITLTASCEPPHITSVIINSCNPTCIEGYNELIFGNTGDYSVTATSANLSISYGSNAPPGTNPVLTDNLTTNPTTTANINTAAGCPGTFVEGTGATIPPGASFMIAHDGLCIDALSWGGLCGSGPIYIIYTTDPDWNVNGTFSNSTAAGFRYFNSSITTTSSDLFSIDYNYDRTQNSGTDGDFVTYSSAGGPPTSYGDDDCFLNPIVLPIELTSFSGKLEERQSILNWSTISERNSDYFSIHHATSSSEFNEIARVNAMGNSQELHEYAFVHTTPSYGINYYQLTGFDLDGSSRNHGIISLNFDSDIAYYDLTTKEIVFHEQCAFKIYSTDGKLITSGSAINTLPFNETGIFFIVDDQSGTRQRLIVY